MHAIDLEIARNFLIALAIGALIGIEREKKKDVEPARSLGGIRTHILLALIGAASAWLSRELDMDWIFIVSLATVGVAVVSNHARTPEAGPGLTSEFAAIATCLLGGMVVIGSPALAVALAIVTSAVLAFKQPLHGLVDKIGTADIYAGIKLLIATFIVLPLLPNHAIDPWQALNPHALWLLVILISALSLLGYVAVRWIGTAHGTALTGVAGGLVSSTAVTLNFARASHSQPQAAAAFSAGILLAWVVMFARALVLAALINPALLRPLWLPFATMGAVAGLFAWRHYCTGLATSEPKEHQDVAVANPFSLSAAIRFGALFAAVLLVVKLAQQYAPGTGLYIVSALAGSVDIDPVMLSIAKDAQGSMNLQPATTAIVIAVLSNTTVKCGMVAALGASTARRHIAVATLTMAAAGALTIWLI